MRKDQLQDVSDIYSILTRSCPAQIVIMHIVQIKILSRVEWHVYVETNETAHSVKMPNGKNGELVDIYSTRKAAIYNAKRTHWRSPNIDYSSNYTSDMTRSEKIQLTEYLEELADDLREKADDAPHIFNEMAERADMAAKAARAEVS
tara:strand:- start:434 stop:874 length:441 start_codon:yes stop_codon:yes gene_type:complete